MGRYYGRRITKRERAGVELLYSSSAPRRQSSYSSHNAFSHSEQCDQFFSVITEPWIPGGIQHIKCRCWCHSTQNLFDSPEPEYDFTPPPEYLSSADRAFALDEPAHVRVGFSLDSPTVTSTDCRTIVDKGAVVLDSRLNEIEARLVIQFPGRSPLELASGKCDNCGDKLADCECVE